VCFSVQQNLIFKTPPLNIVVSMTICTTSVNWYEILLITFLHLTGKLKVTDSRFFIITFLHLTGKLKVTDSKFFYYYISASYRQIEGDRLADELRLQREKRRVARKRCQEDS
jgi:molybdopterin synthase catalytic subunit